MTDALRLGYARLADAHAISLLSRDAVEHGLPWTYRADRIARYVRDPDVVVLVARVGGDFAGFSIMQFGNMSGNTSGNTSGNPRGNIRGRVRSDDLDDERAHLVLMAVTPPFRRRGVGRRLLAWLVESAQVAGVMSIHVELREQNRAAQALYRATGFAESLRIPGYYQGRETAVRMLRLLRTAKVE